MKLKCSFHLLNWNVFAILSKSKRFDSIHSNPLVLSGQWPGFTMAPYFFSHLEQRLTVFVNAVTTLGHT